MATGHDAQGNGMGNRLGPFLCWAVVFADIGTSVYYTPGILYGTVGRLAGFFVFLTLIVFMLLTLKYAEVTARFPEGGGVVTVSSRAMSSWAGALGGMLILVDYFLTASISSLSGIIYLQVIIQSIKPFILPLTILALVLLGLLNLWGIKESARVSAVAATVAFLGDLLVLGAVFTHVPFGTILNVFQEVFTSRQLTGVTLLTGYAGAFLAFSGLESISQLAPVMRVPRKRVSGVALLLVVLTVGLTSPLLTVFSTTLLCQNHLVEGGLLTCIHGANSVDPNQFISILGAVFGGTWLGGVVAVSAAALLVFASNTAIIGAYHVFLALTRMRFFPEIVSAHNSWRGTPTYAIVLATGIPILVLLAVRGAVNLLGDMYAFGLLGAFTMTCLGLDIVRWRERHGASHMGPTQQEEEDEERRQDAYDQELAAQRPESHGPRSYVVEYASMARQRADAEMARLAEPMARARQRLEPVVEALRPARARAAPLRAYWRAVSPDIVYGLGFVTTALVAVAWVTNIINKPLATEFGGGVTIAGLTIAAGYHWYQARVGKPVVFPMHALTPVANSVLVLLPVGSDGEAVLAREAVVRAACQSAAARPVFFLYVSPVWPIQLGPRIMSIRDPYSFDVEAQEALSQSSALSSHLGIAGRQRGFIYRIGGPAQVADVWRIIRPSELVTLFDKRLAHEVQPEHIRIRDVEGFRVAFYVIHPGAATGGPGSGSVMPRPGATSGGSSDSSATVGAGTPGEGGRGVGNSAAGPGAAAGGSGGSRAPGGRAGPGGPAWPGRAGAPSGRTARGGGVASSGGAQPGGGAGRTTRDNAAGGGTTGGAAPAGAPAGARVAPGNDRTTEPTARADGSPTNAPVTPATPATNDRGAEDLGAIAPAEAMAEAEQYVWEDNELKRVEEARPEPAPGSDGQSRQASETPDGAPAGERGTP